MAHAQTNAGTDQEWPGFWKGRTPCWIILDCSLYLRQRCAAYQHPETPCWDHPVTQCDQVLGVDTDCRHCRVLAATGPVAGGPGVGRRNTP